MDKQHKQQVSALAKQVKRFYEQRKPFKVYHGNTNSTRVLTFDRDSMVDVSQLNRVLKVDKKRKIAVVEPNVPMDKLVEATLPHGLVPPVVMEFPGITVAGGLQGGAGESSSFKYGTFNRTLNWYDIMLANGEVLRVSRKQHADLFWGAAGAYGSLGVVTAAEVQLVPAKQYVNVTYLPVTSFTEASDQLQKLTKQSYDYIDGILYGPNNGVIIVGNLNDTPHGPVQTFTKRSDPWFYLHAEKISWAGKSRQESIPIFDYLFRYDRGAFWMGAYAFRHFRTPFNNVTRWLTDPFMHTRRMYDALQASGLSQECIIQDLAMPAKHAPEFLKFIDGEFGFYPLWLLPILPDRHSPLLSLNVNAKMAINVGAWALLGKSEDQMAKLNRKLEREVQRLEGKKCLYGHCYYTEKEFWELYDKPQYDRLRAKYKAETLPDVYSKIRHKPVKVSAKRGLLHVLLGKNGIRIK